LLRFFPASTSPPTKSSGRSGNSVGFVGSIGIVVGMTVLDDWAVVCTAEEDIISGILRPTLELICNFMVELGDEVDLKEALLETADANVPVLLEDKELDKHSSNAAFSSKTSYF